MDPTTRWWARAALLLIAVGPLAARTAADQAAPLPNNVAPAPNACAPGSGSRNWCGDGKAATKAKLAGPTDVAVAPDGSLIVADTENNVIRRIGPDGAIGTLAGDGIATRGPPREVEPARRGRFDGPTGVAVAPDGSVLVADRDNDAIRRITRDGRVRVVMGGRSERITALQQPEDVVALPNGDILVADGSRVLRLTAAGALSELAGYEDLDTPVQLAVQSDGGVLIADEGRARLMRVSPSGTVSTLARGLGRLTGVAVAADGTIYVSRSKRGHSSKTKSEILRLDLVHGGPTVRVAGTGRDGFNGNAGPATEVALSQPSQLAVAPDGAVLIADWGNDRIRRLTPAGFLETVAGRDRPLRAGTVLPPRHGGSGSAVPGAGGKRSDRCYDATTRFWTFLFVPRSVRTLSARATKVVVRVQTSVTARVELVLARNGTLLRKRKVGKVSEAHVSKPIRVSARLRRGVRYWLLVRGRAVSGGHIVRCDRRWVRVKGG